jgi:hypothetical protein
MRLACYPPCNVETFERLNVGTFNMPAHDFGQPQGVAPTMGLPDVVHGFEIDDDHYPGIAIANHVHGNVSRRGRPLCLPMILGKHQEKLRKAEGELRK